MSEFRYVGHVPASKSLLNRALVIQSYFPQLQVKGESRADDVVTMRQALEQLLRGDAIDCGSAGTVLRFMALRAARRPGKHRLIGSPRLFSRPNSELLKILGQLGCAPELLPNELKIQSWGWKMVGDALHVPMDRSSQFASAVVLNAWQLPFELCLLLGPSSVSDAYFDMTLNLVRQLGMNWRREGKEIRISPQQNVLATEYLVEPDMSSAFALAAAAAVSGRVSLTGIPESSLQPDARFVSLLREAGVPILLQKNRLEIHKAESINPLQVSLKDTPDLFPVLAALLAFASGESHLRDADHLIHKESNRIEKTAELLRLCGREVMVFKDGIKIKGMRRVPSIEPLEFDPDQDHRMAMAAGILKLSGEPLRILHSAVVNKSFPGFWDAVGLEP